MTSPYDPEKTSYSTGTMPDLITAQSDISRRIELARQLQDKQQKRLQTLQNLSVRIRHVMVEAGRLCTPGVTTLDYASAQADLICAMFGLNAASQPAVMGFLRQACTMDATLELIVAANPEEGTT